MNTKHITTTVLGIVILGTLLLAACGGNATPTVTDLSSQPTVATGSGQVIAPTAITEPTEDATKTINDLATSVAKVQNPPTVAPSGKITPAPQVNFTRKFHFASLNGTITGWQIVPGDGVTCQTISAVNLVMRVTLENTAAANYSLSSDYIKILGPDDKPSDTIYQGSVYMGKGGSETVLEVPASSTLDQTFCTGITLKDDPNKMTLVLGDKEYVQTRVPLAANGPADLGGYVETPLNKTFTFKTAKFTLPKIIVTTGIWSNQGGDGQPGIGNVWLLLPTQVDNPTNPNLFLEPTEITLQADGQTLAPAQDSNKFYQAAPYGLSKGLTAQGALLFEIPQTTKQVTLHLKSTDSTYPDDVSVPLTVLSLK